MEGRRGEERRGDEEVVYEDEILFLSFLQIDNIIQRPKEEGQVDSFMLYLLNHLGFSSRPQRMTTLATTKDHSVFEKV